MAKHVSTLAEQKARKAEVRSLIVKLVNLGYGVQNRIEAKDLQKLRLELSDIRACINARTNQPVSLY